MDDVLLASVSMVSAAFGALVALVGKHLLVEYLERRALTAAQVRRHSVFEQGASAGRSLEWESVPGLACRRCRTPSVIRPGNDGTLYMCETCGDSWIWKRALHFRDLAGRRLGAMMQNEKEIRERLRNPRAWSKLPSLVLARHRQKRTIRNASRPV